MAARYWVGGTGTWSSTNTTNWSATSGGAGGASVPTSADTPMFDANSGTGVVTFTNGAVTVGATTLNNSGIQLSLGAAFATSSTFTLTAGTFTTNNYNVTAATLFSSNSNVRTINLGSSTVTLSGASTALSAATTTNLTFNAGTSTIIFTNAAGGINAAGLIFYNVSWTNSTLSSPAIFAGNTFNNLSVAGRTTAGVSIFQIGGNQTINGTLTLSPGTNATMRTFVQSTVLGTQRTLTCAAVAALTDIDFRDITIAGAASPVSGTRLGDCKGNSGITFGAAKTVYYRSSTPPANWSSSPNTIVGWTLTPGGTASSANFPLAQDTVVFSTAGTVWPSGATMNIDFAYNIGTIDMSARTSNTMTLATGTTTPTIYGNWINGTGTTLTGTGQMTFAGRGSQTITSAGKTFTQLFQWNTPGGSVTLQDAFVASQAASTVFDFLAGTFNANGYSVTLSAATLARVRLNNGAGIKTLAIGSGTWTVAASGFCWQAAGATNLTVTGTGTINLTSASNKTFEGADIQTYPTLNQGGTGALTITGSNKFAAMTNTAIGSVLFTGGTTNEFGSFSLNGAAGNLLTLGSTNTTQAILTKSGTWNVGANSVDAGNNTGLSFTGGGGIDYLSISYINGVAAGPGTYNVTILESGSGTDSVASKAIVISVATDSAAAADSILARLRFTSNTTESASVTDAAVGNIGMLAQIFEAATATDLTESIKGLFAHIVEAASGTDSITAPGSTYNPSLNEIASVTDNITALAQFVSRVVEAATISDLAAAFKFYLASILESALGTDTANTTATFRSAVTEAATAQDIVRGFMVAAVRIAEASTGADQISALRRIAVAVVEAAAGTDLIAAKAIFRGILQEIAALTDSVNAPGSTYSAPVVELAVLQDLVRAAAVFPVQVLESVTGTQTNSAAFIPYARIAEATTATDTVSALASFSAKIAETGGITDQAAVAPSVFNALAVAAATALDNLSPAGSVYNVTIPESATLADSVVGNFLWNDVDDDQSVAWNFVNDIQNSEWQNVLNSQSSGWQSVDAAPESGWQDINDAQDPNWGKIGN